MGAGTVTGDRKESGFTLVELIIVIALIGILATLVIPNMRETPLRAKSAVLKADLHTMRDVIDQYFADRGEYPEDLEALVQHGYMRMIPKDPITNAVSTWQLIYSSDVKQEDDPSGRGKRGIYDVKSGAGGVDPNGVAWAEY